MSWTMALDFGIANMADALAARHHAGCTRALQHRGRVLPLSRRQLRDHVRPGRWLLPGPQGRWPLARGRQGLQPARMGPRLHRIGWTFAFTAAHDGEGLAALYGGRDKLAAKLDAFFTETADPALAGSYGGTIHDDRSARRAWAYAHSNQPAHHIPWMYLYAGQPWKTQQHVREILSRLYVGSEIGQAVPVTRTTARPRRGTCWHRWACTRCAWAHRST